MLVTGLILALGLFIAVQVSQNIGKSDADGADQPVNSQETPDPNATVDPVIFQSVSEQGGRLRMTGTSAPKAEIKIENKGNELTRVVADDAGAWQAEITVEQDQTLEIDLVVNIREGANIRSDEKLYRIAAPVSNKDTEGADHPALLLITAPGGPSRVFQSPFRGMPTNGGLSLGPIDYDDSGGVIFSGVSEREGRVRIFANNLAVGEIRVAQNGRWFFIAADTLPVGTVDIRTDLIVDGTVMASLEVPFERRVDDHQDSFDVSVNYEPFVWQIRRKLLGGGYQYTAIFAPAEADPVIVEN